MSPAFGSLQVSRNADTQRLVLTDFLKVASSENHGLGHNEKKSYQIFVPSCLRAIALALKDERNGCWFKEILVATTACCEAFVNLQDGADVDKTLLVTRLLYNIIINLKKQEYIEDVTVLMGLLHRMLTADSVLALSESRPVVQAVLTTTWNMVAKMARHKPAEKSTTAATGGGPADLGLQVRLWRVYFDLHCLLPDHSAMIDKLHLIFSDFLLLATSGATIQLSPECSTLICALFDSLVEKMTDLLQLAETDEERCSLSYNTCQVQGLYIEHLVRQADTARARTLVTSMRTGPGLASMVGGVYQVCLDVLGGNQRYTVLAETLKQANEAAENALKDSDQDRLKVLYWTYLYFTRLTKLESVVSECKCGEFMEQSLAAGDIFLAVTATMVEDGGKDRKPAEQLVKLEVNLLKTYNRQLQLMYLVLKSTDGFCSTEDLLNRCLALVGDLKSWLKKDTSCVPSKVLDGYGNNCGWMCSHLGNFTYRECLYSYAVEFYQIAVDLLKGCNEVLQRKLGKYMESMVECHIHLDQMLAASRVVSQALTMTPAGDDHGPYLLLWYRLKKEAIARGHSVFLTLSLASVVQKSAETIPGMTIRQLLQAEYQTWRKASRRNLEVEHRLLCELCEATPGPLEKAQVMVELAANICHTGNTYKGSTAGDILNKAIITLDKHADRAGAVLALAYYTKYDVTHDQVIQEQEKSPEKSSQDDQVGANNGQKPKKKLCTGNFTLESEQPYLPYLRRAVELWHDWFTDDYGAKADKKKAAKAGSDKLSQLPIDLERHLAALMECGTRLILMNQPVLAVKAVRLAHSQLGTVPSGRQREGLQQQLARLWLLLGHYSEAEALILATADADLPASRDSQPVLQAQLCLINGKTEEGVYILNKLLEAKSGCSLMTPQWFMLNGTAKRLLSMFLCFPDSHTLNHAHQYLLSLAFEAVRNHLSVLKSLAKNGGLDKMKTASTDKWMLLQEVLQSIYHLCQLCRFVGMPEDALLYLREGFNISQAYGLPRWSCEFLFEMLRVQSLIREYDMAMDTVDFIYKILEDNDQAPLSSDSLDNLNSACSSTKPGDTVVKKEPGVSDSSEGACFGFEEISGDSKKTPVTPEKDCVTQKLNSACKQRISKLSAPKCMCIKDRQKCEDRVRHKLCVKAGIVLAEFLCQADMRSVAERLLQDSKSGVCEKNGMEAKSNLVDVILYHVSQGSDNGHVADPQLVSTCLEAVCVEAELQLQQNNYRQVQQIWQGMSEVQAAGYLNNILHSNIVMTRLALCQVNAYMRSLSDREPTRSTAVAVDLVGPLSDRVDQLSLTEKKVSFNVKDELVVEGVKMKTARRKLLGGADGSTGEADTGSHADTADAGGTPPTVPGLPDNSATPSNKILTQFGSKSAKKGRLAHMLQTPVSNRKALLDFLIDDDSDEEGDILFPKPKPVTPRVDSVKAKKAGRSKTEPRNRGRKPKAELGALPNPVCNLNDILETADTESVDSNTSCNKDTATNDVGSEKLQCTIVGKEISPVQSEANDNSFVVEGQKVLLGEKTAGRGRGRGRKIPARNVGRKTAPSKSDSEKDETANVNSNIPLRVEKQKALSDSTKTKESKDSSKRRSALKPTVTVNIPNPAISADVYDFKPSPVVSTIAKGKARKTKPAGASVTKPGAASITKPKQSTRTAAKGKENVKSVEPEKKPARERRGRSKKDEEVIELQRNHLEESFHQLELSYEEIADTEQPETVVVLQDDSCHTFEPIPAEDGTPHEFIHTELLSQNQFEVPVDEDFEPIETMRSDVPKPTKKSTRGRKKGPGRQAAEGTSRRSDSVDEEEGSGYLEVMRSSCLVSMETLTQKMNLEEDTEDTVRVASVTAGGDSSMSQSAVLSSLEAVYAQIRHLAWYPQHPEICQGLALQYMDTDPYRAAFLLSDSIAVTFRHQAMLNVGRKARKQTSDRRSGGGAVQQSGDSLTCIKDGLLFDKDETSLRDMISMIPPKWVIVQLSVVSVAAAAGQQFILTRFVSDQNPLVVRLPGFSTPQGRQILKDFSQVLEGNGNSMKIESRAEWWNTREKLNLDLQMITENIEKFWLGPWTTAFLPRQFSEKAVGKVAKDLKKALKKDLDPAQIELLLLSASKLSDAQLCQCARELLRSSCGSDDVDTVVSLVKKHAKPDVTDLNNHHVVLILDKNLQHLPWESVPVLSSLSVSRVPCLSHLYTVLNYLQTQESAVFNRGVDPTNTYYVLNPDGDLPQVEKTFKDWFEKEPGWKGTCGVRPSSEQFSEALTQRDLLIYCGHGSGGRYFGREEIERLQGRAVTVLMGCSSGKLRAKGILEPSGMMLSYFLAGCPCMVANLWDVTDKDIDKFTLDLLQHWLKADDGALLSHQVQRSRQACKMNYLVGSAPVVYGLPVYINRKR